jgi:hypothetical protein
MGLKIYKSGGAIVHVNTDSGTKNIEILANREYRWPAGSMFYYFDTVTALHGVSRIGGESEFTVAHDLTYDQFIKEDNTAFSSDGELNSYLGNLSSPTIDLPLTAFGEVKAEAKTAQVQIKFPYGAVPDLGQELTNKAGSTVTYSDSNAIVTAAATAQSFSQIRSIDTIRYGPGQGSNFLGTCAFTQGVANSTQVFGPGDDDEGLYFGYNGTSFGILRKAYGSLEIKQITITGAADAGGGTFTITLDGDPVTITVAASDTISEVVAAIVAASADFFNAGRGWEVHTPDNLTVHFISLVAESAAGSFSFLDVDSGVTAGAFSEPVAGVAPVDTWVTQANWNVDKMDGTGPSGQTLDPTKGNVYQVQWQYLGYGAQEFAIEQSDTGKLQTVHIIGYSNLAVIPSLLNPTLHANLIIKTETGYSGGALAMKTASMAGFIQGKENPSGLRRSVTVEKSIGTTETVLLILLNGLVFNGLKNKITVFPDFMSFGSESAKIVTLRLYKGPTGITGAAALTAVQSGVSVMSSGSVGTTFTGGAQLLTMIFFGGGERDLGKLSAKIRPGERYLVTAEISSGAASLVNVSMTWVERV